MLIENGQNQNDCCEVRKAFNAATELLMCSYQDYIYRMCVIRLDDKMWAEDVSQDTFMAARQAMPKFQYKSKVSTWLHGICDKKILQANRNHNRRSFLFAEHRHAIAEAMSPDEQTEPVKALVNLVRDWGIHKLSKKDQRLFQRRYVEGETIEELVENSWTSKATMSKYLGKMLQRIQRNLRDGS